MPLFLRRVLFVAIPAGVILVGIGAAVWGDAGLFRRHRMMESLARTQRQLVSLNEENARLRREVEQLRGEESTVRRAIAEDLLLVPPGSTVYRLDPQ
jgi:cell division protein FtsB